MRLSSSSIALAFCCMNQVGANTCQEARRRVDDVKNYANLDQYREISHIVDEQATSDDPKVCSVLFLDEASGSIAKILSPPYFISYGDQSLLNAVAHDTKISGSPYLGDVNHHATQALTSFVHLASGPESDPVAIWNRTKVEGDPWKDWTGSGHEPYESLVGLPLFPILLYFRTSLTEDVLNKFMNMTILASVQANWPFGCNLTETNQIETAIGGFLSGVDDTPAGVTSLNNLLTCLASSNSELSYNYLMKIRDWFSRGEFPGASGSENFQKAFYNMYLEPTPLYLPVPTPLPTQSPSSLPAPSPSLTQLSHNGSSSQTKDDQLKIIAIILTTTISLPIIILAAMWRYGGYCPQIKGKIDALIQSKPNIHLSFHNYHHVRSEKFIELV